MDHRVAGNDRRVLRPDMAAVEIGCDPARLADQQQARRDVPRREALLPEAVEAAGGHVRQVEGSGAGPADAARPDGHPVELLQVLRQPRSILEGKAGADQGERRVRNGRDRQLPVALPGPAAAGRGVDLVARHVHHHAGLELAVDRGGDRHCIARKIVQKVGGAVERIHDPDEPARDQLRAQLLADDTARGLRGQEHVRHDPLGRPVHLGDEVAAPLEGPPGRVRGPLHAPQVCRRPLGGGSRQV